MDLGPFGPLLVIYALLGVRVVLQLVGRWTQTWDDDFTSADRSLVDQAAFFVLVPISVALHELGHAIAVKAYGGTILDWGFYGFAGYVGYDPTGLSPVAQMVITAAGTLVNILLAAISLWLVFGRKPSLRAPYNELLIQFVIISMLNALLLYPLLDLSSGMGGDWSQMYFGEVRWFSLLILLVQVGILAGMWWAWRNPAIQRRIAELTDRPVFTTVRAQRVGMKPGALSFKADSPLEAMLLDTGGRVTSGWPVKVQAAVHPTPDGALLALQWGEDSLHRAVIARAAGDTMEVSGAIAPAGEPPTRRIIGRYPAIPDADQLTIDLRVAMEQVNDWQPLPAAAG